MDDSDFPAEARPRAMPGFHLDPGPNGARLTAPDGARHYLNPSAAVVFLHCDGAHEVAAIARKLAEAYGLDAPPMADVAAALADLARLGAVQSEKRG